MQEVSTVHEPLYPRAQVVGYWDSNNGCMVARAARAPWQLRGEVLDAKEPRVSGGWGWFRSSGLSGKEACCGLLRRAVQPQRAELKILVMWSLSFHGLQAFAGIQLPH